EERALSRSTKDHPLRHEFEARPHRSAHREEADDRRQDGGPADASASEQEDDAPHLGHAGERQEKRPGQAGIDDAAHTTTLTPPATISARSTLPRYTSPSTSCHWTSGALISTERALRCTMISPSARLRKMFQRIPARSMAVRGR